MVVYVTSDNWNPVEYAKRSRNLDADQVLKWDVEDGGAIWLGDGLSGVDISFPCLIDEPDASNGLFSFDIGGVEQIDDEEERMERIKEFSLNYLEGIKQSVCK